MPSELRLALAPLILADQAQEALRARDISRAEGIVAQLIRDHPSFPQGAQIQRQVQQWRARIAQRARIAGLVNAQNWQAAVEEIDRLGLRNDDDPAVIELVRAADAGLAGARARQEAARRAEQERQRQEALVAEQRRLEALEVERREREAREAARREWEAQEAARREQEAREAARREQEAREAERREREAREAARRQWEAQEAERLERERLERERLEREREQRERAERLRQEQAEREHQELTDRERAERQRQAQERLDAASSASRGSRGPDSSRRTASASLPAWRASKRWSARSTQEAGLLAAGGRDPGLRAAPS